MNTSDIRPEKLLQHQIEEYCNLIGAWYFVLGNFRRGKYCNRKGCPDMIILKNSIVWFVELKSKVGKLSADQEKIQAEIAAHGGKYIVVRELQDLPRSGIS